MEEAGSSEGARKKSAHVGVGRLEQAFTGKVGSLGENRGVALMALSHRLRSEDSPPRSRSQVKFRKVRPSRSRKGRCGRP